MVDTFLEWLGVTPTSYINDLLALGFFLVVAFASFIFLSVMGDALLHIFGYKR